MADHPVRHQRRRRADRRVGAAAPDAGPREDRIRGLQDTGLRNLPLQPFTKNILWLELVQLAAELLTWTQTLAFEASIATFWEPKRLRLRVLHVAARITRSGRHEWLRLPRGWPWNDLLTAGHTRLHALS